MSKLLFPLIAPRDYFSSERWPGPRQLLRHPMLAVTWVELAEPAAMTYVTFDRSKELEASGVSVHEQAMTCLRQASSQVITHAKEVDGRIEFGAMMHADGLGTSRLLLLSELADEFPEGFLLGIPERSCGIVMPAGGSPAQRADVESMVSSCYTGGTTPMLDGLFHPELFQLEPT